MTDAAADTPASPPPSPWERERPARARVAPARTPLSRERVVEAAFTVLDRQGLDGLSMRQVAAELGVAVSALYAHVSSKDDLLELMYTRLFTGFEIFFNSSTTTSTALSMPRLRSIGFAPAATFRMPSR